MESLDEQSIVSQRHQFFHVQAAGKNTSDNEIDQGGRNCEPPMLKNKFKIKQEWLPTHIEIETNINTSS